MKLTIRKTMASLAVAATVLVSGGLQAEEKYPFKNEIEARKHFMQVTRFNLSVLGAMVKGNREYNAELAAAAANNMHALAKMDNSLMWPKGSDNAVDGLKAHTDALPDAWSDFDGYMEKHKAWLDATKNLAASAGKSKDDLRKTLGAVGKSCKGCHDDFKQQK
ncbi:cytochrome c [Aliikangiella marina]|uniref:Cytochrome c n=1 Tax=Aliikangiella marina TaxID=1712262 RepID=A0A545T2I0_9GAMM|nr:cytochrome c [Aliikangiella marina]TQV71395.1 cytochrome c [Aliikangiella marina]